MTADNKKLQMLWQLQHLCNENITNIVQEK